jgi:hypothetical protein
MPPELVGPFPQAAILYEPSSENASTPMHHSSSSPFRKHNTTVIVDPRDIIMIEEVKDREVCSSSQEEDP